MKEFSGFGGFAAHLARLAVIGEEVTHHIVKESVHVVADSAREKIGHLQPGDGLFGAWPELAESTKADKAAQGYAYNADFNPLLRTGELYASIEEVAKGNEGAVVSDSQILVYQERGTEHIPPRPVLGSAAFEAKPVIGKFAAEVVLAWIAGAGWRRPKLKVK